MRVPSPLVRRILVAPLVLGAEFLLLVSAPVLAALAALLSPVFGGRRPLRVLALVLAYAGGHLVGVLACVLLWATRRASDQRAHYALLRWFAALVARTALRAGRVHVAVGDSEVAEAALAARERPVVVLSIHSGEGDSLLVLDRLLRHYGRRPRVVMHEALALDPFLDMIGSRLPNRFVDPRGGDTEVEIAAMSHGLGPEDAVLIFPEGGNFTVERRLASIERLERRGHAEEAAWAREMHNLLAPRPGGALAALEAAPEADVVFFAHYGFPHSMRDAWRELAEPRTIDVSLFLVRAGELPDGQDARIDWLFGWWRRLDAWVAEKSSRDR
jgi:1-acyl-sn-glycerol-3-phosphate acyltransferase